MAKTLELELRTRNRTKKERCHYCLDSGYVPILYRPCQPCFHAGRRWEPVAGSAIEEVGPCPFCEQGFYEEFPVSKEKTAIAPPWGPDGFWQGREVVDLQPMEGSESRPLPPQEQARMLRELREKMTGIGVDVAARFAEEDQRSVDALAELGRQVNEEARKPAERPPLVLVKPPPDATAGGLFS